MREGIVWRLHDVILCLSLSARQEELSSAAQSGSSESDRDKRKTEEETYHIPPVRENTRKQYHWLAGRHDRWGS